MRTIGITGGTGLVGSHLARLLTSQGHKVVVFTRGAGARPGIAGITYAHWDAAKGECDQQALAGVDAMVHLAGANVNARWTKAYKQKIYDSRVLGTRFLVERLRQHAPGCRALIAASATGYYGPDAGRPFTENDPPFHDFLGDTCAAWEAEQQKADDLTRRVTLRFGIVLSRDGGAVAELVRPLRFGVMPILAGGSQVVSWIHIDDLAQMIANALDNEQMTGAYNAVAPRPVKHREMMHAMGAARGGIHIPVPVPAFAVKMLLGEMGTEVLKSCTASADKIQQAGFSFKYPEIAQAMGELMKK